MAILATAKRLVPPLRAEGFDEIYSVRLTDPRACQHSRILGTRPRAVADFVARVNKVSPATVILVDEAYHHFVEDPGYQSAIPLAMENPRVIVCRTFSKVYGMAGLRIGYAVGQAEPMRILRRHRLGNSVNVLGAAAAIASLPLTAHVEREKQRNHDARELTRKAFASWGYQTGPSEANFVMVDIRRGPRVPAADHARAHLNRHRRRDAPGDRCVQEGAGGHYFFMTGVQPLTNREPSTRISARS